MKEKITKLSRNELKNVFGGYHSEPVQALDCYSDRDCRKYGEAYVICPDGTSSMTNYYCMAGSCMVNSQFCPPVGEVAAVDER